jgi:hypothetical protein
MAVQAIHKRIPVYFTTIQDLGVIHDCDDSLNVQREMPPTVLLLKNGAFSKLLSSKKPG